MLTRAFFKKVDPLFGRQAMKIWHPSSSVVSSVVKSARTARWPEVLKALGEIGYDGWATSEVKGGGENELRDIAQRMNKVLELS